MKKKKIAFKTSDLFEIGEKVLLIGRESETNPGKEHFSAYRGKYVEEGYPGNIDSSVKRFHGWRGTSYGTETYAYGVREITSKNSTGQKDDWGEEIYKYEVSEDLHPDWE